MNPNTRLSVSRLDPKLTKRGVFPQPSYETTISTSRSGFSNSDSNVESEYSQESSYSDAPVLENTNPRLHLLHNGNWIPREVQ